MIWLLLLFCIDLLLFFLGWFSDSLAHPWVFFFPLFHALAILNVGISQNNLYDFTPFWSCLCCFYLQNLLPGLCLSAWEASLPGTLLMIHCQLLRFGLVYRPLSQNFAKPGRTLCASFPTGSCKLLIARFETLFFLCSSKT